MSASQASESSGASVKLNVDDGAADAIIVTAHGRAEWLGLEIENKGWRVETLDMTKALTDLTAAEPADVEGPFGLFESGDLLPSQLQHFSSRPGLRTVRPSTGFVVWSQTGPIEMKSSLTSRQLSARGVSPVVQKYIEFAKQNTHGLERERRAVAKRVFTETWLAQLAHDFASPFASDNDIAIEKGTASPLFANYALRLRGETGSATKGEQKSHRPLEILSQSGVFSGVKIDGVKEAEATRRGRALVWCLTKSETAKLFPEFVSHFYNETSLEPRYAWTRFRLEALTVKGRTEAESYLHMLPASVMLIDDLELPWEQSNSFVLRVSRQSGEFDIWTRVPYWMCSDATALRDTAIGIERNLSRRFPGSHAKVTVAQSKLNQTAPLWPVYDPAMRAKFSTARRKRVFFHSSDQWMGLDPLSRYRHELTLLQPLVSVFEKLKAEREAAERKRLRKLAQGKSP